MVAVRLIQARNETELIQGNKIRLRAKGPDAKIRHHEALGIWVHLRERDSRADQPLSLTLELLRQLQVVLRPRSFVPDLRYHRTPQPRTRVRRDSPQW